MSLWCDKNRPKTLGALDYHKDQADQLKKLVHSDDFPHLLVYGPSGAGKKTRIMCALRELYGPGVEKLRIERQQFETPSKKTIEMTTLASNYHIEVNASDAGISRDDQEYSHNQSARCQQSKELQGVVNSIPHFIH